MDTTQTSTDSLVPGSECVLLACHETLQSLCNLESQPIDCPAQDPVGGVVIALVSLVGDREWSIFLGLPQDTAEKMATKFAGFPIPYASPDMGDAVGEMTNIMAGNLKRLLDQRGVKVEISLPNVLRGEGLCLLHKNSVSVQKKCFQSPLGLFWTGFLADTQAAGAHWPGFSQPVKS